jgi:hypothetical protein
VAVFTEIFPSKPIPSGSRLNFEDEMPLVGMKSLAALAFRLEITACQVRQNEASAAIQDQYTHAR